MAVGAYASVLSLMRSLDNALLPPRCRLLPNKSRVETLQEKLGSLQQSLELLPSSNTANRDPLLDDPTIKQIREALYEADDVLDKYVVDRLRGAESEDECGNEILSSSFCGDIEALIQRFEAINQELKMIRAKDHGKVVPQLVNSSSHGGASRVDTPDGKNTTMVGFEDHLKKIMERLVETDRNLKIIPIVGMGGIGKTTLARHTFDNRLIMEHFDVRIWLTISQECDVSEILRGLERDGIIEKGDEDLGIRLHKKLFGRRYLIVMDDVWDTVVWDYLKRFFPNNGKKSRIVITTRLLRVADYLGPNNGYSIGFLDEENSWTLFREKSFCNGGWSDDLEEIGRKIVKKCGGLPLALVVIGGLLANSNGDRKYWELVAENTNSFVSSKIDKNCLRILSPSYNHLPIHLKPCFLYMGLFPEDSNIEASELIELWVAEGIVKPDRDRNMEEVAMEYLEDLVGRNMIFVRKLGKIRKIETCGVHDLLRQLCIRESSKEGLWSVPAVQKIHYNPPNDIENLCFLCSKDGTCKRIQLRQVLFGSRSTTPMTPLVCDECNDRYLRLDGSRSVKAIDKLGDELVEIPHLTKVRFLQIKDEYIFPRRRIEFAIPSTVSLLWNLQILYLKSESQLQLQLPIWEMPQLRHIRLLDNALPDPVDANGIIVLKHLQTLDGIRNLRLTNDLVGRIPNLVRLELRYRDRPEPDWSYYCLDNLALLNNLQSLSLRCFDSSLDIKSISFPSSLKELTLFWCRLLWEDMAIIGSLPNLEVLQLYEDAFVGDEWCTVEGQFPKLRYLTIADSDLQYWRTESSHLRVLEKLVLGGLRKLEEFPFDIGDINTLRNIKVRRCSDCVVNSVKEIREEQGCYGNEVLRIEIDKFKYEYNIFKYEYDTENVNACRIQ